ncbi:MAG: 23S rRNA (guanosine(2251)-2'-O)-methyltransferase RlmB [Oscillospiraceae bacterium]|nr:23S rRNA (guanosine(2251)-2'-O)-methyltransferase RlmB [Oscillospiraceae bacterium]
MTEETSDIVVGRNALRELLKSGRQIDKLLIQSGTREGSVIELIAKAKDRKIPVTEVSKSKLDEICVRAGCAANSHQGVAAYTAVIEYASLDDLFAEAETRGEKPFFIMADRISDPHNLGALIRCCEGAGAHGIIIPKRGATGVGAAVMKSSAGAAEYLKICRVTNLAETAETLKKRGVWLFACESGGKKYCEADYDLPLCLILGSEGEGVSRLLRDKSDFVISIPMRGAVNSLNVSCAGAVFMYEALRNRQICAASSDT